MSLGAGGGLEGLSGDFMALIGRTRLAFPHTLALLILHKIFLVRLHGVCNDRFMITSRSMA
jgi:hypothetical protein